MKYEEVPLTTQSGVRIGGSYKPPKKDCMSPEDVFWQGVLLGIEPEFSQRRIVGLALYCFALITLFILLGQLMGEIN